MSDKKIPLVLITGASGFLGSNLVDHFLNKDWRVIGLVRDPGKYKERRNLKYASYDLTAPLDDSVFNGADYLVHAAYIKRDRLHPDAVNDNIEAAKKLLEISRKHGLKKNIFISSMSAHNGAVSGYGKQKLQIEKLFKSHADLSLRPGLIIGNGGIVKNMSAFMKSKHLVPLIGGGKQPLQVIAIYDLVRVIDAGINSNVSGVLTIASPVVYSYKNFYQTLKSKLKTWVIFVPIPFNMLLGIIKLVSLLHLPISINEDSLLGLKMLISVNTQPDLKKLNLEVDDLETIMNKINLI